jgi:hypothetical protein
MNSTPDPHASAVAQPEAKMSFNMFYRQHFLAEHQHIGTVALHVLGTLAGLVFAVWAVMSAWPWLLVLFPVVHAVPGLIGHRIWERNAQVGDLRILRQDFPRWWFIVANHRLTWRLLTGKGIEAPLP